MAVLLRIGDFSQNVIKEAKKIIKASITKSQDKIIWEARQIFKQFLYSSDEYWSIVTGSLVAHFGLQNPSTLMDGIINEIVKAVQVKVTSSIAKKTQLNIKVSIYLFDQDYARLFRLSWSSYYSHEHHIEWLRWFLLGGTSIIITTHRIRFARRESSRSGVAIMVPHGQWSVPEQYAGTINNNWITRTADKASAFIARYVLDKYIVRRA